MLSSSAPAARRSGEGQQQQAPEPGRGDTKTESNPRLNLSDLTNSDSFALQLVPPGLLSAFQLSSPRAHCRCCWLGALAGCCTPWPWLSIRGFYIHHVLFSLTIKTVSTYTVAVVGSSQLIIVFFPLFSPSPTFPLPDDLVSTHLQDRSVDT